MQIYMYKLLICKKKTGRKNGSGRQSEQKKKDKVKAMQHVQKALDPTPFM